MAEVIYLRPNQMAQFVVVRGIFEQAFSRTPLLEGLFLSPMKHIESVSAYTASGEVLGGLMRGVNPNFEAIIVYLLAVREDVRGREIGAELLKSLEGFALARGIRQVRLKPRENWRTERFYKRQGYEFDRSLLGKGYLFKMLG